MHIMHDKNKLRVHYFKSKTKRIDHSGNSGIYLMGLYEVQVLDSWENETYNNGQAGSIYKQYSPLVNACRK